MLNLLLRSTPAPHLYKITVLGVDDLTATWPIGMLPRLELSVASR